MNFLKEEIIIKKYKEGSSYNAFQDSNLVHEKDSYAKFEVIKVGQNQTEVQVGNKVLVNQNGLGKELTIQGFGILPDTYAIMNSSRILCVLDEE